MTNSIKGLLIQNYWNACKERGEKPKPVYALKHLPGSTQPPDYVQGWSISRTAARKMVQRMGGDYHIAIERILP